MSRDLPAHANLVHLKKQAKALLDERLQSNPRATLAEAQHALAREYGFSNWAKLKQHVVSLAPALDPRMAFARAVIDDKLSDTRKLLGRYSELRRTINDAIPGGDFGEKPLSVATRHRNRAMIDLLIGAGADVNDRSDWWAGGFGLLEGCDPDIATFLLSRGARLYAHAAARLGMFDPLRDIIKQNPNAVHERGGDGQFPLHFSATPQIAELLLENGAEIDAIDIDHESTAAQWALRDRRDVARFLVDRGARCDILMASALGDTSRVRAILDADPDAVATAVNDQFFPMHNPRAGGTIYIWTVGANKTAYDVAREFGYHEIIALLMSAANDEMKLAIACENGDDPAIEKLLASRPGLTISLPPAYQQRITAAASGNRMEAVRRMLRVGWPVVPDAPGEATPLHHAAWLGNADMTRELLAHGAPTEVRESRFGGTPLGWALHGSRFCGERRTGDYAGVVEALMAAGVVAPELSDEEMTALPEALRAILLRYRTIRMDSRFHGNDEKRDR